MKNLKTFVQELDEAGRCWTGYKPVKGKKPYSQGSCVKEEDELQEKEDCGITFMLVERKDYLLRNQDRRVILRH